MVGIDTNVLVRFIVQDDAAQSRIASTFIEERCSAENPGLVGLIVLCELVWVLSRAYGYSRDQISTTLRQVLVTESLEIRAHDMAWSAMLDYSGGMGDYADCLMARINERDGAVTTVTFDKQANRNKRFTLLTGEFLRLAQE